MRFQLRFQPYLIWGCAALFYMYQFVLRVSPSVMMEDLMTFFQISAAEIGTLSALALYAYSLLQIPSGVLADVFGVRKVILGSLFLCILGVAIFISTPNLMLAKFGRILLGSGSAAAFLCLSKLSVQLFSPNRRASLFGLTMAAGTIGALNGSMPLSFLITFVGWRQSLAWIIGVGLVILALNALFLKEQRSQPSPKKHKFELKEVILPVVDTMKLRACWMNGIAALGIYLSVSVIADLWGVSFLMQAHQVSKTAAAQAVSFIYVGLCVGSLVLTFVSDLLKRRKAVILICTLGLLFGISSLIYLTHLPFLGVMVLLFFIGFCSGAEMLCFASASDQTNSTVLS
jgi:sugar phosphate permease